MKLLIVDDNPINQKFLLYSLRKYFELSVANNGLEAVELLEKEKIDVVLMDLSMPVMDGAEATRKLRESNKLWNRFIPVIFVTTNDIEEEMQRCFESGGDDYLIKPVVIDELIFSINNQITMKKSLFENIQNTIQAQMNDN